jgi:glycosyltransferase involved in cell wall biosynthesis
VDDREEHAFHMAFAEIFGSVATSRLIEPLLLRPLARLLRDRLTEASHIWLSAAEDASAFEGLSTSTITNVPFFKVSAKETRPSSCRDVLFVGTFGHTPNRAGVNWFLSEVWPQIANAVPEARFRIVGTGDWASLRARHPRLESVDYVGSVDDISEEYMRARLAISPIRQGGGSKIKVIEACSFGRPVVSTSHSSRGFANVFAELIAVADESTDFANACIHYLRDPDAADKHGDQLRALQRSTFSREANEDLIGRDIMSVVTASPQG